MPTTFPRKRTRSLRALLSRANDETNVLDVLADGGIVGCGRGEIEERLRARGVKVSDLGAVLEFLVANFRACRYEGGVYGITELGRKRLAPTPPLCVVS